MAVSLKHAFQSAKPDGADTSIVRPSDWNAEHVLTQASGKLLGRTSAGTGATEEITAGSGLALSAGTLTADVTSVAGRTGAVTLAVADVSGAAPTASPALTGTPTAPTAASGTNTTQIATTAYVQGEGYLKAATASATYLTISTASATYAPLASPTFTGTVTLPSTTAIGSVTSTELGYLSGVTSSIQTQINAKLSTSATTYVQQSGPTGSAYLPAGTTAQRPGTPAAGYIRYNSTTGKFEGFGTSWGNIGGGAAIGDTPPANPGAGDLWWNSADGRMYVYYTDANSSQWVDLSAGGAGQYLPLTGGDVTGNVSVTGNFGIGTTTPDRKLVVSGNNATLGVYATNGGNLSLDAPVAGTGQIDIAGANAFRINTNGAERMRIDASGRVTMPYQPAFSVTGPYSGGVYNISVGAGSGYTILWQGIGVNNGSYYSTSTGRFTAPVAGMYVFQLSIANSGTTSGPLGYIRKNGGSFAVCIAYQSGTAYNTASVTSVVNLAAGDYVDAYFMAFNVGAAIDLSYSNFCGYLIG